jgi:hypothetical protein
VHFAYVTADHVAVDPMPALVAWLHEAERRLRSHDHRSGGTPDVVGLLHLPAPETEPAFAAPVSSVSTAGLPGSARDRFLVAVVLLSPFGWAAVAVAMRRRRAIAELSRD